MLSLRRFSRLSEYADLTWLRLEAKWNRLKERFSGEEGAMTIEYILIIALIAIIIITIFTVLLWPILRPALEELIQRIQNAINGGNIATIRSEIFSISMISDWTLVLKKLEKISVGMAITKPKAVVIRASEIPPANMRGFTLASWERVANTEIIPITVPSKPSSGAEAAIEPSAVR